MTEPINYRYEAQAWLDTAVEHYPNTSDPSLTAGILALVHAFLSIDEDDLDPEDAEEQHQSERFVATPLVSHEDAPTVRTPKMVPFGYPGGAA